MLAVVAAIVFAILSMAVDSVKGFIASIILLVAAGFMAIGLIIYAAKRELQSLEIGWSYILGWIGVIGAIAAGVMGFFAEKC